MTKKRAGLVIGEILAPAAGAGDDQGFTGTRQPPVVATHSRKGRGRAKAGVTSNAGLPAAKIPRKGRTASDGVTPDADLPSVKSPARGRRAKATKALPEGAATIAPSAPTDSADRREADNQSVSVSGGDGHRIVGVLNGNAVATNSSGEFAAAGGEGQVVTDDQKRRALADLIADVVDTHHLRRSLLVAEGDLTRRIKSKERSAAVYRYRKNGIELPKGKFPPVSTDDIALIAALYPSFYKARAIIEAQRKEVEKRLIKTANGLPVVDWAERVRGFGILSLAAVIGEAGDLSKYSNPGKLWKRMGLAVFDGKSQRKTTNAEDAIRQGYSPERRSVMFVIGDNLIRASNPEYRPIYDARKAYELERAPDMKPIIIHRRAKRYMEKRLLRELWKAWRQAIRGTEPSVMVPDAEISMAAE